MRARWRCWPRSASTSRRTRIVGELGVGKQQLVEIAKALVQAGPPADPRRADRQPERARQRRPAAPARRVPGTAASPRILISHKLNEVAIRRRPHHRAPRRPHRGDHRLRAGPAPEDRIIRAHGQPRHGPPLPAPRAPDRRDRVPGRGLVGHPSERGPARRCRMSIFGGPPRRDRRHRRADGRGADRVRDEPVRPRLGPRHRGPGVHRRARGRPLHRAARDRGRARLRDRRPQSARPAAGRRHPQERRARQPRKPSPAAASSTTCRS